MTREELRNKATARRNYNQDGEGKKPKWFCSYCERAFMSEKVFMSHNCKEKLRHEEIRSPVGQAAYSYYSEWMRAQKHTVPAIDTFSQSKFYGQFIKFAKHATKTHIPNVKQFIRLMVENGNVPPVLWCRDNVYSLYLKSYDAAVTPQEQFFQSLELLEELSRELKVPLPNIYPKVGVETLVELIKRRKLTYWFLLASAKFREYILSISGDERDALTDALNAGAAYTRISQEPGLFKEFSEGAKLVGL